MSRVFPFISVDGAKDAIELYKQAFNAEVVGEITTYEEFFPDHPDKDNIAHAALSIGGSPLFIGDAKDQPYKDQVRVTVNVELPTIESVQKSFSVLQKEAREVFYEPCDVGWSELGYSLRDQYGILWMVYYRK
ncbi:VOC family protein [Candidatus Xianfuyuplasma coldseepsis]|uniref:Glyoxalase/fosfomycin resistance/dioxygenase domain-containing protein n=1 Tax=Candidatus Xianfuyuplasma coldseepsis TaxID=2782163 RepID=A0A7L7KRE3_9MOLU|nr:VOC family protein [Xianfuyuplasma coldseepsis]QMS85303.1 hypothetical protein G4Z02_05905 [Xianfuyuplasma coldseepsis]